MECPRCLQPLLAAEHDAAGVPVQTLACPSCDGHWVEAESLHHIEETVEIALLQWRRLPGMETQARTLFCPRCQPQKVMDKVLSERDQRVVMDVCPHCRGVWLDGGELEAIERKGMLAALADVLKLTR